jgi:diguanylate cyclase (GGDEF)-like protein
MRKELRQMDILTRYAGDEFVAIMPMASGQVAISVGERIRSAIEAQKFTVRPDKFESVGISVGVACYPDDGETTEELLTAAARKMQANKHTRKTVINLSNDSVVSLDAFR